MLLVIRTSKNGVVFMDLYRSQESTIPLYSEVSHSNNSHKLATMRMNGKIKELKKQKEDIEISFIEL